MREPRWVRPFVIVAAALVLLLVGATGGLLIGRSGVPEVPAADSVDVGFLQDMSVHHGQAVEMASWERDHTTDPELRQLAFDIERHPDRPDRPDAGVAGAVGGLGAAGRHGRT